MLYLSLAGEWKMALSTGLCATPGGYPGEKRGGLGSSQVDTKMEEEMITTWQLKQAVLLLFP